MSHAGGARVAGVGLLTGWGQGIDALPDDAHVVAEGRAVVAIPPPTITDERFRRLTRECLLGIAATDAALRTTGLSRDEVRGEATALLYATAGAYGASNREFIAGTAAGAVGAPAGGGSPLRFPYTAPSAVPAEVSIEFGVTGDYTVLIGGATATLEALWQAAALIARGEASRALVLAVETFSECADLYRRGRRLLQGPLVESAACAVLVPAMHAPVWRAGGPAGDLEALAKRRAGETLACSPLIALALGQVQGAAGVRCDTSAAITGEWRGRRAALTWETT
jgi:hypothetical protein